MRAEGVDLGGEACLAVEQPALLRLQVLDLRGQRARLGLDRLLARERGAGQVLAAQREGLARLSLQPSGLLHQARQLPLDARFGGGYLGDAASHLLQHLHLLFERVIQHLGRILGLTHGPVHLGLDDVGEPAKHAAHCVAPSIIHV